MRRHEGPEPWWPLQESAEVALAPRKTRMGCYLTNRSVTRRVWVGVLITQLVPRNSWRAVLHSCRFEAESESPKGDSIDQRDPVNFHEVYKVDVRGAECSEKEQKNSRKGSQEKNGTGQMMPLAVAASVQRHSWQVVDTVNVCKRPSIFLRKKLDHRVLPFWWRSARGGLRPDFRVAKERGDRCTFYLIRINIVVGIEARAKMPAMSDWTMTSAMYRTHNPVWM